MALQCTDDWDDAAHADPIARAHAHFVPLLRGDAHMQASDEVRSMFAAEWAAPIAAAAAPADGTPAGAAAGAAATAGHVTVDTITGTTTSTVKKHLVLCVRTGIHVLPLPPVTPTATATSMPCADAGVGSDAAAASASGPAHVAAATTVLNDAHALVHGNDLRRIAPYVTATGGLAGVYVSVDQGVEAVCRGAAGSMMLSPATAPAPPSSSSASAWRGFDGERVAAFAGAGSVGPDGLLRSSSWPYGLVASRDGRTLYVADHDHALASVQLLLQDRKPQDSVALPPPELKRIAGGLTAKGAAFMAAREAKHSAKLAALAAAKKAVAASADAARDADGDDNNEEDGGDEDDDDDDPEYDADDERIAVLPDAVLCARHTLPRPKSMVFDAYANSGPDAVLYVTTLHANALARVQLPAGTVSYLPLRLVSDSRSAASADTACSSLRSEAKAAKTTTRSIVPHDVVFLPCGLLLISCDTTHALYVVEPDTGLTKCVAGGGASSVSGGGGGDEKTHTPAGAWLTGARALAVSADECVAYVSTRDLVSGDARVTRVALPPLLCTRPLYDTAALTATLEALTEAHTAGADSSARAVLPLPVALVGVIVGFVSRSFRIHKF